VAKDAILCAVVTITLASAVLGAIEAPQTSPSTDAAHERFDVVSLKENTSGRFESFAYPYANTGRLRLVNHTAMQMIRQAYGVWDYQVVGGPQWLDRVRYDLEAKASGPTTHDGLMRRLRSLLEDEFKLVTRIENRDGAILHLVAVKAGRTGPSLVVAQPQDAQLYPVGAKAGGMRGRGATMADLAATLSNLQHRLVVDKTGFAGIYDFELDYAVERQRPPGVPADALPPRNDDAPALATALEQQLGVRFESARGPVPTLIIVSAQPPHTDATTSAK